MAEIKRAEGPVRQCAGCGARFPKSALLRAVKGSSGAAVPDPDGKAQCRGVYICRNAKCLSRAIKNGKISRQLRCPTDTAAFAALNLPEVSS